MGSEQYVEWLNELGLNSYEARAYLALLGRDSFSASQLSDQSGVPRQRIYDILASLVERGMVVSRPTRRVQRYAGVDPQVVLTRLLATEQARLDGLEERTRTLIERLDQHYHAGRTRHAPLEFIEVLRGEAAISQRVNELCDGCRQELLYSTGTPLANGSSYDRPSPDGWQGLRSDVRVRALYPTAVRAERDGGTWLAACYERGEMIRLCRDLPLSLLIVDGKAVLMHMQSPVGPAEEECTVLLLSHPNFAAVMSLAFETLWQQATCYTPDPVGMTTGV